MTWNYRIINHGSWFGLHEVYYDEAGAPELYTADPVSFSADFGEGVEGIVGSLEMALADARDRPVLHVDAFPKPKNADPAGTDGR